ncbi:restriction endonuclease subunit S [Shewanella inventionis]|uniref:Type I restriction system specificity protein n=1 Tax=Shewanella inventionis TaxID=1738770 RepID=A0ABQ1JHU3_9GAMM|nr:restriction endonuclease subunit S [Shewanella inventionis]MCL1159225.1 restriction endonuclease subunit S [Shewanella inventionis]GGB67590.1 type I restriction system specificity protein [Shewanella inventionis]
MSCNWPTVKLGEYCSKIGSGATPKGGNSVYLDSGDISLIRSQNIYNDRFKAEGLVYITSEAAQKLKNVIIEPNDVLINITGDSVARVCLAPNEYLPARVNQHVAILRVVPDEFDHRYLRYFLTSNKMQNYLLTIASTGGTRNALTKTMLESLEVSKPPLGVQKQIGDVLENFESKIMLNSITNQTLEEMAQTIFKSWFVDFDPVKAKMNGEQPEGMDAATASLFPEKLVESELGLIPEGWELKTLKSLSEKISKGTTPSKMDLESATDEPSIRFIKVRDINEQGEILRGKLENIPDSIHTTKLKRSILKKEDILFSIAGTIGRVAIVDQDLDNVNTNQAVAFVRLKEKQTYLPLVYMALRENRLQQKAIASIVQGVQANLSLANVGDMEVIVPSEDILNLWNKQYSSILQMIKNNFAQSRVLASLRDTLLPKLLSGEIELGTLGDNAND